MKLLETRAKTHGDFEKSAALSQAIKYYLNARSRITLSNVQRESLDMICTKLARIVCGDPNCVDHWEDIAGYAELVVKDLRLKERDLVEVTPVR